MLHDLMRVLFPVYFFTTAYIVARLTHGKRRRWHTQDAARYTRVEQLGIGCGAYVLFILPLMALGIWGAFNSIVRLIFDSNIFFLLYPVIGGLYVTWVYGTIIISAIFKRAPAKTLVKDDEPTSYR